jgi:trk system potassium uptake protein TrkH
MDAPAETQYLLTPPAPGPSGLRDAMRLAGYFFLLGVIGSILLMSPGAVPEDKTFFYDDALLTAVSASCLAGLSGRDLSVDFTPFGQTVLLCLIQAGGILALSFGVIVVKRVAGQRARDISQAGECFSDGYLLRTIVRVTIATAVLEAVGVVLLYPVFTSAMHSPVKAASEAIFLSVSAFCNSGMTLSGENLREGLSSGWTIPLRDQWQLLGVIAPLVVLGSLGLPVLGDFLRAVGNIFRRGEKFTLSLHTKLSLVTAAVLILAGALGLLLVEPPPGPRTNIIGLDPFYESEGRIRNDWREMDTPRRARQALFLSISARSAGFSTINVSELSDAGKLWLCGLMLTGGTPGGAGGGFRTAVLAMAMAAVAGVIFRRDGVYAGGRKIRGDVLRGAAAMAAIYAAFIFAFVLALSVQMRPGYNFLDVLFEACSACSGGGFSTGLTAKLNVPAKYLVSVMMYLGRVGLPAMALILACRSGVSEPDDAETIPLA